MIEIQATPFPFSFPPGKTALVIAHRLSTLRKADRLVVLDRGQVVEIGQHEELLARQGAYHALYEAQNRQNEDEAGAAPPQASPGEVKHA